MNVYRANPSGTCGLDVIYGFNGYNQDELRRYGYPINRLAPRGAGFSVAGFLNTPKCKKAYEELSEKWKTVYQSPVRVNRNTNNKFFFVIYDTLTEKEN